MIIIPRVSVCIVSWLPVLCLAGTGCDALLGKEPNPTYCGSDPCPPPDTGGCSSNAACGSALVCDVMGSKQCVQCTATDHGACTANTPICGTDNACRACIAHSECPSDACSFADGACAAETDVAYVDSAGTTGASNSTCLKSAPCTSLVTALATGRRYVRIQGTGTIDEAVTVDSGRVATILADFGATLMHDGAGVGLTVTGDGTSLTVYNLTISNSIGSGIAVPRGGGEPVLSLIHTVISNHLLGGLSIEAGTFELVRSAVSNNRDGGIVIDGSATFFIVGNTFFVNGSLNSTTGAVRITAKQSPDNRLDFNSFLNNQARSNGGAIQCDAGATFTASNNIIYNPNVVGEPITGSCGHAYSLIQPGTVPPGAHNIMGDPSFMNLTMGDLHLLPGSPAFHAADPSANVTGLALHDIDGKPRLPPPATLGAYQMK